MKVLNSDQMRNIDRKTIQEIGIPGSILMENAGIQIFRALLAAVYAHGLSGDVGVEKLGKKALTASDIISFLPRALRSLESFSNPTV